MLVRKPDPVAIITFNADYTAGGWEEPKNEKYRKSLSQYSPEPTKLWINALYEIPVISASLFMLSLASKEGAGANLIQRTSIQQNHGIRIDVAILDIMDT